MYGTAGLLLVTPTKAGKAHTTGMVSKWYFDCAIKRICGIIALERPQSG